MTNLENPLKGLPKCACVHSDAATCARMRDGYSDGDDDWEWRKCECDCHDDSEPFPERL